MIGTILQISLLRLWNNKQELLLIFVVPILFFSIFALIFSRGVGRDTTCLKVAVVDEDQSQLTQSVVDELVRAGVARAKNGLRLRHGTDGGSVESRHYPRSQGRSGNSFSARIGYECAPQCALAVGLLAEGSNPVARQLIGALLSRAMSVNVAKIAGPRGNQRPPEPAASESMLAARTTPVSDAVPAREAFRFAESDVFADTKTNPQIAMYAAGIAVMFLLFSASGAGGSLLEEHEAGTLDRLLSSQLTVTQLLAGKWLFIVLMGCVQITIMFSWAQLVFGVDLFGHLPGFCLMTIATASATASLALCLAVVCQSRSQLNGVSVVLILSMSALGGSMVPRFLMSESMQRIGKLTFNAWALDGYQKVFWYELPLSALRLELAILFSIAAYLAIVARVFSDRWEMR